MNLQSIDDMHRPPQHKSKQYSSVYGLLERSDEKHDVERFKVGPLRLTANYQHPPIDSRTQIQTTCIVIMAIVLSFVMPLLLRSWLWKGRVSFWGSMLTMPYMWMTLLCPVIILSWWKLGGQWREKRLMRDLSATQSPLMGEARIEIRGRPSELLKFAEIEDELFEPRIFQMSHTMLGMPLQMRLVLAFGFVGIASYILAGFQRYWWVGASMLILAYFFLRGIPCRHRYYRFVPGRMDFLVYPWLRSIKPMQVTQFHLRDAHIRIDLTSRKEMILVAPSEDNLDNPLKRTKHLLFRRDNTPQPLEFAIALVRATLSTATPPPLPMDALTG